jgi:hypothetical protein
MYLAIAGKKQDRRAHTHFFDTGEKSGETYRVLI